MKMTKRTKRIILIALVAAITISSGIFCGIQIAKESRIRSLYAKYDACSEELNLLIEFLQHKYSDEKSRPDFLRIAGGKKLLDPKTGFVNIPDEISRILTVLEEECFVRENVKMNVITFHGSRIQINSENGVYAIVYSPDGVPAYLHEAGEDFPIKIKHIEGYWYHVSRIG